MKCFNHPEKDAAAICLACGRGVCPGCAIASENGIACKQSCAENLAAENALQSKQADHLRSIKRMNLLGSFFSIGAGLLFIYFSSQGSGLVYDFIFLLGTGFTVYGIMVQLVNIVIFFKAKKNAQH